MKRFLGALLGEDPSLPYDPSKYDHHRNIGGRYYGDGQASEESGNPSEESGRPIEREDGGKGALKGKGVKGAGKGKKGPEEEDDLPPPAFDPDTNAMAQEEPTGLGCWLLPQDYVNRSGADRQNRYTRLSTGAPTQVAVAAPANYMGAAEYDNETFRTSFDVSQPVVCTGSLINTYTGEVADTFENALPPPDRQSGDFNREVKTAQRRLQVAQGNEPWRLNKTELQQPLPAADAGVVLPDANFRQMQEVKLEAAERFTRDTYFNRNDLIPTEYQFTKNPFGYQGFQNMLRVNPFMPVTQELDNRDWAPNATQLPTTEVSARPETRLHSDSHPGRVGLVQGQLPEVPVDPEVRQSLSSRHLQESDDGCRGFEGPLAAVAKDAEMRLASERTQHNAPFGGVRAYGQAAAPGGAVRLAAKDIMATLGGTQMGVAGRADMDAHPAERSVMLAPERQLYGRGAPGDIQSHEAGYAPAVGERVGKREDALVPEQRLYGDNPLPRGHTALAGLEATLRPDHAPPTQHGAPRVTFEAPAPHATSEQHLYGDRTSFQERGGHVASVSGSRAFAEEVDLRGETLPQVDRSYAFREGASASVSASRLKDEREPRTRGGDVTGFGGDPRANVAESRLRRERAQHCRGGEVAPVVNGHRGPAGEFSLGDARGLYQSAWWSNSQNGADAQLYKTRNVPDTAGVARAPDELTESRSWVGMDSSHRLDGTRAQDRRRRRTPKPQRPDVASCQRSGLPRLTEALASRSE